MAADDSRELTCEDAEAMLPLVADGVLLEEDDPQLFAHLAECPAAAPVW